MLPDTLWNQLRVLGLEDLVIHCLFWIRLPWESDCNVAICLGITDETYLRSLPSFLPVSKHGPFYIHKPMSKVFFLGIRSKRSMDLEPGDLVSLPGLASNEFCDMGRILYFLLSLISSFIPRWEWTEFLKPYFQIGCLIFFVIFEI